MTKTFYIGYKDIEREKYFFYAKIGEQSYSWHTDFQSSTGNTKPEAKVLLHTLSTQSGNGEKKLKIIRIKMEVVS